MMGEMTLWMLVGLLLVALVIAAAVYLAVRAAGDGGGREGGPRATLRRRLASGEISTEEYREREAALDDRSSRPDRGDGRDA